MRKKLLAVAAIVAIAHLLPSLSIAQDKKEFTVIKESWTQPYTSQGETGLCAVFSDMSFLESELHRLGRGEFELSTMYVSYYQYIEKALRRIRLRGKIDFGFNGSFNSVAFEIIKKYGVVPLSDYTGLLSGQTEHHHFGFIKEMNIYLEGTVEADGRDGRLDSQWKDGIFHSSWLDNIKDIINRNMGRPPSTIKYNGKIMSPKEFADEVLAIPYDDYLKITSYSYLGFYQKGEMLADGNWLHQNDYYNVRLSEFIDLIDYALNNGYTLTGDFHITEESYRGDLGYADYQPDTSSTVVDQDMRDDLYENWQTNDVHNVHIIGIARDESGKKYYKIKDSAPKKVFPKSPIYFSENYFRARVLSVMLHKDGIPPEIKSKLSISK